MDLYPQRFDLCWCSEFVDNIEAQFVDNFLKTMRAATYVAMTHSLQPHEYWIEKMENHGFRLAKILTEQAHEKTLFSWGGMIFRS